MHKQICFFFTFFWLFHLTELKAHPKTELWNEIVEKYVDQEGGVNYIGLSKEKKLNSFIKSYQNLRADEIKSWTNTQKTAFYINLYNATMMANLLRFAHEKKIPVASSQFIHLKINDIEVPGGNIWDGDYKVDIAGLKINLDGIEHGLIRGADIPDGFSGFEVSKLDPRIHSAVNCAAISCPRVREIAYTPTNINQMLNENMKEFLESDDQFRMIDNNTMYANSIVFWYYADFDKQKPGAGTYLSQFLTVDKTKPKSTNYLKKKHFEENFNDTSRFVLKLSSSFDFDYNWAINDQRNKNLRSKP
ncbi:MAG: DUF547 domain-containing protein [Oligoflexales bacterium]